MINKSIWNKDRNNSMINSGKKIVSKQLQGNEGKDLIINEIPTRGISDKDLIYRIFAGDDKNKDQSYFLCQLSQEQLAKAIFPLGELTKPEVRKIAKEADLPSAEKKDSQGICFVGKVDLPVFLQQKLKPKEGKVVEIFKKDFPAIDERRISELGTAEELIKLSTPVKYKESDGKIIGTHIGVQYYTIGQRHGLNIGGHPGSIFIIATDIESNTIYVGEGSDHPGLYRKGLMIKNSDIHWIRRDLTMKEGESREYLVRIRYRQPLQKATDRKSTRLNSSHQIISYAVFC